MMAEMVVSAYLMVEGVRLKKLELHYKCKNEQQFVDPL